VAALALPGLLMASAASATASPVAATAVAGTARMTAATTQAGKPTTVQPSSSPGARTGAAIPAKPRGLRENAPVSTWTVTLTANPNLLWPTQYSTLTATASTDVGPTPYYLRIYDRTAGDYVVTCATGTTCSTPVTQPGQSTHYYVAVVSYASTGYPPSGEQAVSGDVGVVWHGVNLTLAASPTTVPVGAASTLTATTSQNIGLSPFWIEIFDVTTGTNVALCGSGTTCRATVSQGAQFRRSVLEKDGNEAVGAVVMMRHGENPLQVTKRIKDKNWQDWFSFASHGDDPFIVYMTEVFINHCLNLVHELLNAFGAYCKAHISVNNVIEIEIIPPTR